MPGLRCSDRERDRLQIAHFSHHDDVRIFTERTAQGGGEALRVGADLTLGDVATTSASKMLDWVLESVMICSRPLRFTCSTRAARVVDLPPADRAGDKNEPVMKAGRI
jgi:hypothetical protein